MNRFERRNRAIDEAIRGHIDEYKAIYKKSDTEDRDPTEEERLEIESHLAAIEVLKDEKDSVEANIKTLRDVDDLGRQIGPALSVVSEPEDRLFQTLNERVFPAAQKSIGEQFTSSKGYKSALDAYGAGGLPEGFSTGKVELDLKGTLLEGSSSPGSGSGGGLLPVPQVVPGVVETLFQQLHVADLLLSGQASGNTLRYVIEGTATSGAAGVGEAGTKPESTLGIGTKDEPIKKIATFLPVSDEMLEDAPAIQGYINSRLMLFIRIEEERQLIRGTSGGNEVQGLLTSRSVPVYTGGTADNKAAQLFKAANSMRGSAFIEPEWFILHPTDFQIVRLLTDTAGQFFGGGPFLGPYGGPQGPIDMSNQVGGGVDMLWGKPCYVTAAVGGAGTALVGTRANAQVWRRGGVSVEASNSHASFFQLNLVALRAEERIGLAVYRPSGYVEARLAVGPGG
jgi:HK97 family phage major capsid protein